jgi:hypothetical protein
VVSLKFKVLPVALCMSYLGPTMGSSVVSSVRLRHRSYLVESGGVRCIVSDKIEGTSAILVRSGGDCVMEYYDPESSAIPFIDRLRYVYVNKPRANVIKKLVDGISQILYILSYSFAIIVYLSYYWTRVDVTCVLCKAIPIAISGVVYNCAIILVCCVLCDREMSTVGSCREVLVDCGKARCAIVCCFLKGVRVEAASLAVEDRRAWQERDYSEAELMSRHHDKVLVDRDYLCSESPDCLLRDWISEEAWSMLREMWMSAKGVSICAEGCVWICSSP